MKKNFFFLVCLLCFSSRYAWTENISSDDEYMEIIKEINNDPQSTMEKLLHVNTPEAKAQYLLLVSYYGNEIEKQKIPQIYKEVLSTKGIHDEKCVNNSPTDIYRFMHCLKNTINVYKVYVPCEYYLKLPYSSSYPNTCIFLDKYNFPKEVDEYLKIIFPQAVAPDTTIYGTIHYYPKFRNVKKHKYPNAEMLFSNYENMREYKKFISTGIGYLKAKNMLSNHYIKVFGFNKTQAETIAEEVLTMPLPPSYIQPDSDTLRYKIVDGVSYKEIEEFMKTHRDNDKHIVEPEIYSKMDSILHIAFFRPDVLKLILDMCPFEQHYDYCQELGTNVDAINYKGETPLIKAAQYGIKESIKILLAKGANPTIKDKKGKNMKDYLAENN